MIVLNAPKLPVSAPAKDGAVCAVVQRCRWPCALCLASAQRGPCRGVPPAAPRPPAPSVRQSRSGFRSRRSAPEPRTHTRIHYPALSRRFVWGPCAPRPPVGNHCQSVTPSSSGGRAGRGEVTGFLSVAGQAGGDSHSSSIRGQDRPPETASRVAAKLSAPPSKSSHFSADRTSFLFRERCSPLDCLPGLAPRTGPQDRHPQDRGSSPPGPAPGTPGCPQDWPHLLKPADPERTCVLQSPRSALPAPARPPAAGTLHARGQASAPAARCAWTP